jgi:regulatory protein
MPNRPQQPRKPRKASPKRLESIALHYLQRFASSSENLRRVLMRRVVKSARAHDTDPQEAVPWIDDIIARFRRSGLLDDAGYAQGMTHSLSRRGMPARAIRARLRQKGVDGAVADSALARLVEEVGDPDLAAALALVRRRRLGPYRSGDARGDFRAKDLAAMARAGFAYDIARRVIEAESPEALADGEFGAY